jgi:hypothetical protein
MKYVIPISLVELESENYHLTVSCLFANGADGLWVIDTGASKSVFDEALKTLYEPVETDENTQIQSAGIGAGRLETTLGKLQPFKLAGFNIESLQVAIIDLSHINKLYFHATEKEICGLIGSDFLLNNKAVIDYGALELVLEID